MSVPLEKLYHYLNDLIPQDIVIYRWYPHGSKKIQDLKPLLPRPRSENFIKPVIIANDQEPLNYDFYSRNVIGEHISGNLFSRLGIVLSHQDLDKISSMNLNACCSSIYKPILLHSEVNSRDLERYRSLGNLDVYYWCHALIARDWYRYASVDPLLKKSSDHYEKTFLLYGRSWTGSREYRIKITENLIDTGLISDTLTSFAPVDSGVHYRDYHWSSKMYAPTRHDLEKYFDLNLANSNSSADYVAEDYNRCGIEIVSETIFDSTSIHLTEKTLRPIACGKPFILFAAPGALEYLHRYGFRTFDGLINEYYDTVADSQDRFQEIFREITRLSNLDTQQKKNFYRKVREISEFNQQHFFSTQFSDLVINEYRSNMIRAVDRTLSMSPDFSEFRRIKKYLDAPGYNRGLVKDNELLNIFNNLGSN